MTTKYRVIISRDDRHLFFVDDEGQIVSANQVLGDASVFGCTFTYANNTNRFDPVTYINVVSDERFTNGEIFILIGAQNE